MRIKNKKYLIIFLCILYLQFETHRFSEYSIKIAK